MKTYCTIIEMSNHAIHLYLCGYIQNYLISKYPSPPIHSFKIKPVTVFLSHLIIVSIFLRYATTIM